MTLIEKRHILSNEDTKMTYSKAETLEPEDEEIKEDLKELETGGYSKNDGQKKV